MKKHSFICKLAKFPAFFFHFYIIKLYFVIFSCYNRHMIRLKSMFIRKRIADASIPPHVHPCYEFVYYFTGDGSCTFAGHVTEFKQGTYTCVSPDVLHSEKFDHHSNSMVILFESDETLQPLQKYLIRSDKYVNIREWIDKINAEYANKAYHYKRNIECMLEILLTEIVRKQTLQTPQYDRHNMAEIQTYFDEYFMTKIDLNELAHDCGYSVNHFRKLFVKMYGVPPKKYLLEKRLTLAKKLLTQTDQPIEQISTNCGFGYYSEFALFFKKHTGTAPAAFRRSFSQT